MPIAKPSAGLLRELTDEHILRALMSVPRLTRAELAVATGLSKPTVAESIRRLESLGLVADTGERTSGRGGVGTYYALDSSVGVAVAVNLAAEGVVAEAIDAAGHVRARVAEPVGRPAAPTAVKRLLAKAVRASIKAADRGVARTAIVSAADPVDRASGALVHLPDSPFLVGTLSPVKALAELIDGPVVVDNDVNWAARAERAARMEGSRADDFVYLHLGEGLGGAVVADGEVRRGHRGLTGEIAHIRTRGVDGAATPFIDVFGPLGLRHTGSTAIDVDRLRRRLSGADGGDLSRVLARAVGDVVSAAIAFADPQMIVIGGPWGTERMLLDAVRRQVDVAPRPVPVEPARVIDEPALAGARNAAIAALHADIVRRATQRD